MPYFCGYLRKYNHKPLLVQFTKNSIHQYVKRTQVGNVVTKYFLK